MKNLLLLLVAALPANALDTARIDQLTGLKGKLNAKAGVYKVAYPRADIAATVGGVRITPPLGLTAWAAFMPAGKQAMVMGDMVLTESQVDPVMSAALDNGLDVTALHNHFLYESPRVMFMHISGMGPEETLAKAVGAVFAKLKETAGAKAPPMPAIDPEKGSLEAKPLEEILQAKAEASGGVLKFTFDRMTKMGGHTVGGAMGVNTWAAFAGTPEKAVVDGDVAMKERELQGVLKSLRGAGISIVAIHSHMSEETPRILFLHYWGTGPAADLAKAMRAVVDLQTAQ